MGFAGPITRTRIGVKLRPSSYLMLGMVRLGASSGYAIKKAADMSTRVFWPTSLAQVYPELARLEDAGLVQRHANPRGRRNRAAYQITEQGESALLAWLSSTREAPTQVRDEGLLRLFFADALSPDDQITLVARLAETARQAAAQITDEVVPVAQLVKDDGKRFPAEVARFGADVYLYSAQWLDRLRVELEDEQKASGG